MSDTRRPSESSSGFQVIFERPDRPSPSPPAGEPTFRPRRYHTKSRNGCFNCKKRRIKCDEAQPECSHCWEKSLQCEYPPGRTSPPPRTPSLPSPIRQPSRSGQASQRLGLSDPRISATLDSDEVPGEPLIQQGYQRSDVFDLLHHFVIPTEHAWIGSPHAQGLAQDHVRRNAADAPYLLYSALAFSAAHMHYLHPADSKYRAAAAYHYQHSLRAYFDKLSGTLDNDDADSLFVSCQLHAFLAFLNAGSAHDDQGGVDMGWIRSMRGTRFITESPQLMLSLQRGDFGSVLRSTGANWKEICGQGQSDADARVAADTQQLQSLENLCAGLHTERRDALSYAITMLRDLAQLKPEPAAVSTFMIWINRQSSTFIDLLEDGEPLALLTIAFWCALICRVDEWWIVEPARAECRRVCEHVGGLYDSTYDSVLSYLQSIY